MSNVHFIDKRTPWMVDSESPQDFANRLQVANIEIQGEMKVLGEKLNAAIDANDVSLLGMPLAELQERIYRIQLVSGDLSIFVLGVLTQVSHDLDAIITGKFDV